MGNGSMGELSVEQLPLSLFRCSIFVCATFGLLSAKSLSRQGWWRKDAANKRPARPLFNVGGQLEKAVPADCFNRSLLRFLSYLTLDLLVASALLYSTFVTLAGPLGWISWFLYWVAQGCMLTGAWVNVHECGHHAFRDYSWLVSYSWLLVSYSLRKFSLRRHHSNSGSMLKYEVFMPKSRDLLGITSMLWKHSFQKIALYCHLL